MKKTLLSLMALCAISLAAHADLTVSFKSQTTFTGTADGKDVTIEDVTFHFGNANAYIGGTSGTGAYIMLKGNSSTPGYITFSLPFDCSAIELTTPGSPSTKDTNKVTLSVNDTDVETIAVNAGSKTFTLSTKEYTQAGTVYKIKGPSASVNSQIQQFKFIQAGSIVQQDCGLEYENASFDVVLGENFTAPALVNPNNLTVTYTSGNEEVATVDASTGAVTIAGAGTAKITAAFEGNEAFRKGEASYTINVTDPNACEVTYDFVANTYGLTREDTGFTTSGTLENGIVSLEMAKTAGSGFRLWTDGLRVYKTSSTYGATLTVSATGAKITGIEIVRAATALSFKVDDVDMTAAENNSNKFVWTGRATKPVISINATDNKAIKTIKITYEPVSGDLTDPELAFSAGSVTTVEGEAFTAPELTNKYNLAVIYTSSNPEVATVAADGAVTIVAPGKTTIKATTAETDVYSEGEASYLLTVVASHSSVDDFHGMDKNEVGYINFPMTVVYANGLNCYTVSHTEGDKAALLYGNHNYAEGDVIPAGWMATRGEYGGAHQIALSHELPAATETRSHDVPEVDAISAADLHRIVWLRGVTFGTSTPSAKENFIGTIDAPEVPAADDATATGTQSIDFRNNFTVGSVEPGKYNVKVAVNSFNGTLQALPIEYENFVATGIETVVATEGEVEYYTLQGIKVAEPAHGVYIRRQGSKAVKVVL